MVFAIAACDLEVSNPNSPDVPRAFSDPAGLEALISGALRTWVGTREDYFIMALNMQADNYTASWNNAAIRFYSSVGSDCASRCGWTNSSTAPEAAGGPTVESAWYGYHTVLSSADDVVGSDKPRESASTPIAPRTARKTTRASRWSQDAARRWRSPGIAIIYDSGFAVDENDRSQRPARAPVQRPGADAGLSRCTKFNEAYAAAGGAVWTTENDWFGLAGPNYTNVQIQQLIRTMQAELIAMWPRNATENAAADWASVATYASQGVRSRAPFDMEYQIDVNAAQCGLACVKTWGNSTARCASIPASPR